MAAGLPAVSWKGPFLSDRGPDRTRPGFMELADVWFFESIKFIMKHFISQAAVIKIFLQSISEAESPQTSHTLFDD